MRKSLLASALISSLVLTASVANANPYDRALYAQQCNEIRSEVSAGNVLASTLLFGVIGGFSAAGVNNKRYDDCLARFGVLPGESLQFANRPVTNQSYGGKYGAGVVHAGGTAGGACPPKFYGMYRGTYYCHNGVLLR